MDDNKKYPKTLHLPFTKCATSDDKIASIEQVEMLLSKKIIITEKMDGENCCISAMGVYARSHAAYTTSPWSIEVRKLQGVIGRDLSEDMSIFGENMEGVHSILYEKLDSYFYVFGVRINETFLKWDETKELCFLLDLKTVPVIFEGNITYKELEELSKDIMSKGSQYGSIKEGFVVRNYDGFLETNFSKNVFKYVRSHHIQTDSHWTKNWKRAKLCNH